MHQSPPTQQERQLVLEGAFLLCLDSGEKVWREINVWVTCSLYRAYGENLEFRKFLLLCFQKRCASLEFITKGLLKVHKSFCIVIL
jgi:hypothetical protein